MKELLLQHFWLVLIVVTIADAAVWRYRGRKYVAQKPELAKGYQRLTRGLMIWGSVPWIVMGVGLTVGGVPSIRAYLSPKAADPWVLSWFGSIFLVWVWGFRWIFFHGGAEMLVQHPGFLDVPVSNPRIVKWVCAVFLVVGSVAIAIMFSTDGLIPYWKSKAGDFTTVFVVYDGFWRVVALALLFFAIGATALIISVKWIRSLKIPKWWNRKEGFKPGFILFWSVLWLVGCSVGFSANIWQSYKLVSIYRNGSDQFVEGTVHVLHEQPEGGHTEGDIIEVSGVRLTIDYFLVTPAYKITIAHGGVLREGVYARLYYHGKKILRVDIRK